MGKDELMLGLRKRLATAPVINNRYVGDDGCFCAIGHLMDMTGVNMNEVRAYANSTTITRLVVERPLFLRPLLIAGFAVDELQRIQDLNDGYDTEKERKDHLGRYIDRQLNVHFMPQQPIERE